MAGKSSVCGNLCKPGIIRFGTGATKIWAVLQDGDDKICIVAWRNDCAIFDFEMKVKYIFFLDL